MINKYIKIFLIFFFFLILVVLFIKYKNDEQKSVEKNIPEEPVSNYNTNVIENVNYTSIDAEGNEYKIHALTGEIDTSNSEVLFLKKVTALIKLKNLEEIAISSDYGKYNANNFDTIFSKNVLITYLDNKITGEYLDLSLERNSMIISRNVIYKNLNTTLKSDVIEVNIKTKNTKIFMYENNKKVNIEIK